MKYLNEILLVDLKKFESIVKPKELSSFILKNRNTPIFRIRPVKRFINGVISKKYLGSILLHQYQNDGMNNYYTFRIKIKQEGKINKDYAVVIGEECYTIMLIEDCKEVFEYVQDEKINRSDEEILLNSIEDITDLK